MATSVIVSPRYYSHFCLATQQNGHTFSGCSLGIGDRRSENSLFTMQNCPTNIWLLMTIFYADMERLL